MAVREAPTYSSAVRVCVCVCACGVVNRRRGIVAILL